MTIDTEAERRTKHFYAVAFKDGRTWRLAPYEWQADPAQAQRIISFILTSGSCRDCMTVAHIELEEPQR